jgi:hypothetical protein
LLTKLSYKEMLEIDKQVKIVLNIEVWKMLKQSAYYF